MERAATQEKAFRPWRQFEVREVWNRPRYALTAPVALVRGYCVTPGLWGFPVGLEIERQTQP
jgi:hypothetical protein